MAHWEDARIAIEKRLKDNWITTPIRFWSSGVPFEVKPGVSYIAVSIDTFDGRQISLGEGTQLHRYQEQVTIQILVPEGRGSKVADGYADTLDTLFRRQSFSHGASGQITCRTPVKSVVGVRNGWYQVNLRIPYQRDKQH